MKAFLGIFALLVVALSLPLQAGPKKKHPGGGVPETPEYRIFETNAVAVTVSIGTDGNSHQTFKVTDTTKVTLDGAPAFARDLKAGMMAQFVLSPDRGTALAVTAKDAPAHPRKHRDG